MTSIVTSLLLHSRINRFIRPAARFRIPHFTMLSTRTLLVDFYSLTILYILFFPLDRFLRQPSYTLQVERQLLNSVPSSKQRCSFSQLQTRS
ncbi:hypothetical protein SISSUDRAFT_113382 [Sistotremastrum suecicum HHB10207 ss-3]|uniref:Uncharacterized protein n=1 Tax=Sistotremastrum suecicum HHB10207 ss-3 TaxID=1314776 RepID=A0A166H0K3_9AGAM|nr:hypothetical protein SISSUDRAFT_113382 [Sistotremastrum suecicum HHB10207 ss-3]